MQEQCVVGVDLGGTKALAGVVAADGAVLHRGFRLVPKGANTEAVIELLCESVAEAEQATGAQAAAVGLGIPSLVDKDTGRAGSTTHLPLRDVPVRDLLSERLGVPVAVANDATCAIVSEHRAGAAQGTDTALLITIGTGIGGGIVTHGKVLHGASGAAAEFGHMTFDPDGGPCKGDCPNHGCWEHSVSGTALGRAVREAAEADPDSTLARAGAEGRTLDGSLATELAHDGDGLSRELIEEMGRKLGIGLANLVNVFNPEVIVIGGGAMAAGELLLAPARQVVSERALSPSRDDVRIVATHFGDAAGMIGAAMLAGDRLEAGT